MIAVLLGCGLRRAEVAGLTVEDLQQREEHWVIADLVGKGGYLGCKQRLRNAVNDKIGLEPASA